MNRLTLHRLLLWAVLLIFAAWFLTPLYVMVVTSLKDAEQLRVGNLLSLPTAPTLDAWSKAWSSACTGVQCEGLQPFFWNSVITVVPAVLVSTLLGALNGYVLSKWKFPGSETLFAFMLFGVFMPMQVVLLPMSQVLGWLGIASSVWGLVFVHVLAGIPSTTLFFRNYYVGLPDELIKAAMLDGADREEADARAAGRSRLAAASVRYLKHLANELAQHGTVDAAADAPADEPTRGKFLARGKTVQERLGRIQAKDEKALAILMADDYGNLHGHAAQVKGAALWATPDSLANVRESLARAPAILAPGTEEQGNREQRTTPLRHSRFATSDGARAARMLPSHRSGTATPARSAR